MITIEFEAKVNDRFQQIKDINCSDRAYEQFAYVCMYIDIDA